MTLPLQVPPPGFENLSSKEKLAYVRWLWAEVVSAPDGAALTAGQQAELDRRLHAHRADPSAARPWSEVRAELRAKHDRRE